MTPSERANLDQGASILGDMLPGVWATMYETLQARGLSSETALAMTQTYIAVSNICSGSNIVLNLTKGGRGDDPVDTKET